MSLCFTRLRKEYKELIKNPIADIRAVPRETNVLEWHYVVNGPKGTPYEGGWYHGMLIFPSDYPYKPPSIQMITPNGRFKTHTRLCLSMSDFHPESWNPLWSVGTILMGLHSFMQEETPTYGSIVATDAYRRQCAKESMEVNCKNKIFAELFPDLVEQHNESKKLQEVKENSLSESVVINKPSDDDNSKLSQSTSWTAIIGMLAAIIAFTWALLSLAL
eukprot:gene11546-15465_t